MFRVRAVQVPTRVQSIFPREYSPGETVRYSGLYHVIHRDHREDHYAIALEGEQFPTCRKCDEQVRYRLWTKAEPIAEDQDLQGSTAAVVNA